MSSTPIFVVGAPRSGTTLLAKILGRHKEILAPAPGETWFFEDIWTRRSEFGELKSSAELDPVAERLLSNFRRFDGIEAQLIVDRELNKDDVIKYALELGGGYGGLYFAFTNLMAIKCGKSYYCDDTPKHLFYLETILEMFPEVKIICCIRDPRGFLASYKNMANLNRIADNSDEQTRVGKLYHPVVTASLWLASARLIHKFSRPYFSDRILLVQYEKFVKNPVIQTQRICDFIELDFSNEMLMVSDHNSSFGVRNHPGIFTNSVDGWNKFLSLEEVWWVETLTKKMMRTFGYDLSEPKVSPSGIIRIVLNAPTALIGALGSNRGRRGPIFSYITKRALSLIGLR